MTKSELDHKLDAVMSKYMSHLDTKFDHIDTKFSHMESRFTQMENKFDQVDRNFAKMDGRYNWIIGLILTASLSIIGSIIGIMVKIH